MRITGGKYRSRVVKCPPGVIRPAMDRMRESMFSILGDLRDLSFLDLFSGSGVIGLEAASRGATDIQMVELDRGKKKVIMENLSIAKENIKINFADAAIYLEQSNRDFDIIHLDPPFPVEDKLRFIELVEKHNVLKPQGTLMMHYPDSESYPEEIGKLRQYDLRKYGGSMLVFYTRD
ncbi:MAG: 16S rRNA (guanine(966)-N(2))-methyltransferase RsmD [Spirochaetaceae bacterium 4572_7]|nr:MAG: 16S rRNA (guanine(966)-N(2))-methyltransferase RsmD [Spirochaetaceae bacterium 4572_7]